MALYGLEKIRSTMELMWQYGGDFLCAKTVNEVNFDHDAIYPKCIVIEPNSVMPSIYEGWENYSYEVYFCELWKKINRDASERDQKWDNIQFIGNEWLDNVLDYYSNEDLILDDESLTIDRIKNFGNDKLLAIKFTFTLQGFRTCFNPKQNLPDWMWGGEWIYGGSYSMKCTDGTVVYIAKDDEIACRGWWRFDGWKEMVMVDTVRYVLALKDMAYYPRPASHYACCNDFLLTNENYGSTDTSGCAILKSNTSNSNSKFYGDQIGGQGDDPTVYGQYSTGLKVVCNGDNNRYNPLSSTAWTICMVFELGEDANADNGRYVFSTGQGQTLNCDGCDVLGYGIEIYFDAGWMVLDFMKPDLTKQTFMWQVPVIFGGDCYSKEDRTVAFVMGYDGSVLLTLQVPQKSQVVNVFPIQGLTGSATPFWNLNPTYVFSKAGDPSDTNNWKGKVYECILYNFMLASYPTTNNKSTTHNYYTDVANYFAEKYGLTFNA